MPVMLLDTDNFVPISDFSHGKAAQAFAKTRIAPVIVLKNNQPEAFILSPEQFYDMRQAIEDYEDYCLAVERLERSDPSTWISWEDHLAAEGITQEELDAMPDVEID